MIPLRIFGATRVLGRSQGYVGLPVLDAELEGTPVMFTAWEPTPEELDLLNNGGHVRLAILGTQHPPVRLFVCPTGTEK